MSAEVDKTILITGAAGFVGRKLAQAMRLRWPRAKLRLVDRVPAEIEAGPVEPLDIADSELVVAAIAEIKPDIVYHLAAISAVPTALKDARNTWLVNTMGALNLVEAVREHAPWAHFIFISSAEVYGRTSHSGEPVTETSLLQPNNPYAVSKAAADLMVQEAAGRGLKTTILRPFNHFGPGQTPSFAIPAFCEQIARIEKGLQSNPLLHGELDDERDFLPVDDVISLYLKVVEQAAALESGVVLNVASGVPRRIRDVLATLQAKAATAIELRADPEKQRPNRVPRVVGDASKARALLGWKPEHNFEETLFATLEDWRSKV